MSDTSQGEGWWKASDDKWYSPEQHPAYRSLPPPPSPLPQSFETSPSDGRPPESTAHEVSKPAPRTGRIVVIGVVVLAIVAAIGYLVTNDGATTPSGTVIDTVTVGAT